MFSLLLFGEDGHTGSMPGSVKLKGSVYFFFYLHAVHFPEGVSASLPQHWSSH